MPELNQIDIFKIRLIATVKQSITPKQEREILDRFYDDFVGSMYDRAKYAIESVLGPQSFDIRDEMKKRN